MDESLSSNKTNVLFQRILQDFKVTDQHLGIIATPGTPTMTIETGTDSVNLDLAHITLDIGVTVTVILAEAILDHFTGPHIIALYTLYCYCCDTPHWRSSSCRNFSRDDSRSRTYKSNRHHYKPTEISSSSSQSIPWKPKD